MKNVKISKKQFAKIKSRKAPSGITINFGVTDDGIMEVESIDVPDDWDDKDVRKFRKAYGLANSAGYLIALAESGKSTTNTDGSFYKDVMANTKSVLFMHGFKAAADIKYDMTESLLNAPIMMDHERRVSMVMGRYESMGVTEDGLKLRLHYRAPESVKNPELHDALVAVRDGLAPAVSLSGYWLMDESGTVANEVLVNEVSSVWRGSDPLAGAYLADPTEPTEGSKTKEVSQELSTSWDLGNYLIALGQNKDKEN